MILAISFSRTDFEVGETPLSVVAGNFNEDQNTDLAVVNLESNNVSVLFGDGLGDFGNRTDLSVGEFPTFVATEDFNLDGNLDLAVANNGNNNVSVLLGVDVL